MLILPPQNGLQLNTLKQLVQPLCLLSVIVLCHALKLALPLCDVAKNADLQD